MILIGFGLIDEGWVEMEPVRGGHCSAILSKSDQFKASLNEHDCLWRSQSAIS